MEKIKSIYNKYENSVDMDGKKSESSQTFRRVRQGTVFSSMLFNMVMDKNKKCRKDLLVS
jgi:hypothetical protein